MILLPLPRGLLLHTSIFFIQGRLEKAEEGVHLAMCDNIDTRRVLETLRELVVASNAYIEKTRVGEPGVNRHVTLAA